jgi:hypothetical protein
MNALRATVLHGTVPPGGALLQKEVVHVKTYILIQAMPQIDRMELVRWVVGVPGVERVEAVTGAYDLIAEARSDDATDLLGAIAALDGVLRAIDAPVVGAGDRQPAAA